MTTSPSGVSPYVRDLSAALLARSGELGAELAELIMSSDIRYRDETVVPTDDLVRSCRDNVELLFADRWRPRRRPRLPRRPRGHVALVQVRGTISPGRSRRAPTGRIAGSDTVGAALRAAAADERVRVVTGTAVRR